MHHYGDRVRADVLPSSWRDRLVLAVVVALFAVPAAVLVAGPKPGRFSFQMYTGYGVLSATWEDSDRRVHVVRLGEHLASARAEVDWTRVLPERLCTWFPDAVRVEVSRTQPGGTRRRSVEC